MVDPTGFAASRFAGFGNDIYTTTNYGFTNRSSKGNDVSTTQTYRKKREGRYGNDRFSYVPHKEIVRQNNNLDFRIDLKNLDWENTDENVVLEARYISAYKGKLVIISPDLGMSAFSFGVIVLGDQVKNRSDAVATVRHEYGHTQQLERIGIYNYIYFVAIPSLKGSYLSSKGKLPYEYNSAPWEYEADMLGGADRKNTDPKHQYEPWAKENNERYWNFVYRLPNMDNFPYKQAIRSIF